ncbi:MAG: FHA domain-containing protein [Prochlorothrix sp.]
MITLALLHPLQETPVQKWSFKPDSTVRIGRANDNNVVLYSAVVSRHHVEIRGQGNGWEVVNLGTNGTYIDGQRVDKFAAKDGMVIRLARSGPMIQIRLDDPLPDIATKTMVDAPSIEDLTRPVQ